MPKRTKITPCHTKLAELYHQRCPSAASRRSRSWLNTVTAVCWFRRNVLFEEQAGFLSLGLGECFLDVLLHCHQIDSRLLGHFRLYENIISSITAIPYIPVPNSHPPTLLQSASSCIGFSSRIAASQTRYLASRIGLYSNPCLVNRRLLCPEY